jgi:hypothetical protein
MQPARRFVSTVLVGACEDGANGGRIPLFSAPGGRHALAVQPVGDRSVIPTKLLDAGASGALVCLSASCGFGGASACRRFGAYGHVDGADDERRPGERQRARALCEQQHPEPDGHQWVDVLVRDDERDRG